MAMGAKTADKAGLELAAADGRRHARRDRVMRGLAAALALVWAVGCEAASARVNDGPPPGTTVSAPPPPSVMAPAAPMSAEREATPDPRSRPGLGTEWGEERDSPIRDVPFKRSDARHPLAETELRYDDERGVRGLAAYSAGRSAREHATSAAGGAISIWLQDGDSKPLDVVQTAGRTLVIGDAGQRYSIFLENHTAHRFEAVATVDGLDVINGKPGTLSNRGYLLLPYETLEIDGFRQSEQTVAAFRFGRVSNAYAAQVGPGRDIGVIGIAFFGESGDIWTPWADGEVQRRATAHPFPADRPSDDRFAAPPWR